MNLKFIVGIDVFKYFSEMVVIFFVNEIVVCLIIYYNNFFDFDRVIEIFKKVEEDFAVCFIIVMEVIGYYYKIFFCFFIFNGWDVVIINSI